MPSSIFIKKQMNSVASWSVDICLLSKIVVGLVIFFVLFSIQLVKYCLNYDFCDFYDYDVHKIINCLNYDFCDSYDSYDYDVHKNHKLSEL